MKLSRPSAALLVAVAVLAAGPAHGQSTSAPQQPELDCSDAQTTVDMVNCIGRDFEAAEASLTAIIKQQTEFLDEPGLGLFHAAQDAWAAFREAECLRVRDYVRGGTMAAVLGSACMVELTRLRAAQLSGATAEEAMVRR